MMSGMNTYAVRVQKNGKVWVETVTCGDINTAKEIVRDRYPGCVILDAHRED